MKTITNTRQKVRRGLLLASLALFPVTFYWLSPAVPLQGAAEGVVAGSLIVFALLFVQSLLLGRLFCGWVCPAGGLQELTALVRKRPVEPAKGELDQVPRVGAVAGNRRVPLHPGRRREAGGSDVPDLAWHLRG